MKNSDKQIRLLPPHRPALLLAALLLAVLSTSPQRSSAQLSNIRPNVLLVLSDDHSAAHVGAYGNPDIKTPNLDKFAAQGMRFERAYVAAPQCVPSRAALMTGCFRQQAMRHA